MNRREFISASGAALLSTAFRTSVSRGQETKPADGRSIIWHRHEASRLFDQVAVDGHTLLDPEEKVGLFSGFCQVMQAGLPGREVLFNSSNPAGRCDAIQVALTHQLHGSIGSQQDLLEARLTLRNTSDQSCEVFTGFLAGARPTRDPVQQQVYLPLSAAALGDPTGDARGRLKDCAQTVGPQGLVCHYLEVQASDPRNTTTRAPLLAPVVDISAAGGPCHLALMGTSTEPMLFEAPQGNSSRAWRLGRRVRLEPGQTREVKAFLLLHSGDAAEAWKVFHAFGHHDDHPALAWPHDVRVHYYDFLSGVEPNGPRGGGYDLDLGHFGEFHVGMATQHGYYLAYGDFIHPDRKEWKAMPADAAGPVAMTLEKVKARVDATRKAGVHPAIYMHFTILDEGSPLFEKMTDAIMVGPDGKPTPFGWQGPDTIKKSWRMSTTAPQWREHLVQQARWIMELWNPDAIVLDETFASWGFDHHKEHGGPLSQGGIELMRQLRSTVRSFGKDKALLASDCSMSNFCMWGDGESGDHCYDRLLGHELYRQPPIRYMAALGGKAWIPCAWLDKSLWPIQVDLARKTGAAVGVSNGWGDNLGLTHLPEDAKTQMLRDIDALARRNTPGRS